MQIKRDIGELYEMGGYFVTLLLVSAQIQELDIFSFLQL